MLYVGLWETIRFVLKKDFLCMRIFDKSFVFVCFMGSMRNHLYDCINTFNIGLYQYRCKLKKYKVKYKIVW